MPSSPLQLNEIDLDAIDLSNEKLKRLAGTGAFNRGVEYFKQNPRVTYKIDGTKITANVTGNYVYTQELTFALQGVDGFCSCPASENIDFCKHCVVVALAVREGQTNNHLTNKPRATAKQKETNTIKQFIEKLDRSDIENSLLKLITEDKAQFSQWSLRAHNALNPADEKFLKKKITQAFPINKHLHRYSQVAQYFSNAEPIVNLLVQQHEGLSSNALFSLTDYALSRLDKALETIDDSGGFRFHCQDNLNTLFIKGVEAKQFNQQQLVEFLIEKLQESNDILPDIPSAYHHLLGDQGNDAFYQALLLLWQETPVPSATEKGYDSWDENSHYHTFFYQLMRYARQTKNQLLLIELQQRNARSASDLVKLVELLIETKQWELANVTLKRAEKSKDSHYVINQLLNARIQLLVHKQQYSEAYILLNQSFNDKPSFSLYKKMHQFNEQFHLNSGSHEVSFSPQEVIDKLRRRQAEDSLNQFIFSRLILDILFYHQRYSDILKIESEDKLPKEYLSRLIDAFPNSPETTLALYEKLVASYLGFSDNEHYRHAISALLTAQKDCLTTQSQNEFSDLLERLTTRYKAKRNFIKYLKEAFGIVK